MTELLKIGHTEYSWEPPYEFGMELDALTTEYLNNSAKRDLRLRLWRKVKMGMTQADFDTYMETYQLGVRSAGKTAFDEVTARAIDIAKVFIRSDLKAKGKKYDAKLVAQLAKQAAPQFRDIAAQRILEDQHLAKTLALDPQVKSLLKEIKAA